MITEIDGYDMYDNSFVVVKLVNFLGNWLTVPQKFQQLYNTIRKIEGLMTK